MEELQPLLDDNGIRYKIDYIAFKVGVPWIENLVDCIYKSNRVLDRDVLRLSGKYELQEGTSRGLERQQALFTHRAANGLREQGGFPETDQGSNIYRLYITASWRGSSGNILSLKLW